MHDRRHGGRRKHTYRSPLRVSALYQLVWHIKLCDAGPCRVSHGSSTACTEAKSVSLQHEPQRGLRVPTIAHATRLIKLLGQRKKPDRKVLRCVRTRRELDTDAHPLHRVAPRLRCCWTSDENGSVTRATTGCETSDGVIKKAVCLTRNKNAVTYSLLRDAV